MKFLYSLTLSFFLIATGLVYTSNLFAESCQNRFNDTKILPEVIQKIKKALTNVRLIRNFGRALYSKAYESDSPSRRTNSELKSLVAELTISPVTTRLIDLGLNQKDENFIKQTLEKTYSEFDQNTGPYYISDTYAVITPAGTKNTKPKLVGIFITLEGDGIPEVTFVSEYEFLKPAYGKY